jgi:hypothetical protein
MNQPVSQKHVMTKVEEVDGAFAVDIPADFFKRLRIADGSTLLWTFNDDGTVTLSHVAFS